MAPADCVIVSGRMLGPREYEVLQLLCEHGPATVRELLCSLSAEPPITYQTLMTICVRLFEKGLVERRVALSAAEVLQYGKAYIYTPLVRDVIDLQPIAPPPAPSAAVWEIRARQAEMQVQALRRRAIAAERRAAEAEQRVQVLLKELAGTPRPGRLPASRFTSFRNGVSKAVPR